jgi:phage baseplate assembly protein W|tara:strand:+ start:229 stop:609 length:381 start_codon:yes stop_codon:yes gene_type:complete
MAEIIGYSTIDRYKTYTVTDFEIIKQDLSNALNIRQGEMPGRPDVGTIMWSFIYEPQNAQTSKAVISEIQRVVAQDPRIEVADINVFSQENGILVELEIQTIQGQDARLLSVFFDNQTQRASLSDV